MVWDHGPNNLLDPVQLVQVAVPGKEGFAIQKLALIIDEQRGQLKGVKGLKLAHFLP
jgi:hypothetical protein